MAFWWQEREGRGIDRADDGNAGSTMMMGLS
ncbi:hypothetical protein MY4824_004855 [Beauveria thailandica]